MVANRLTWQNVAAPDFSTALDGMQGAGQAWARGFDGLSGALGDWRTRQKEQASAEALGKAMGITSTGGWDQAMAGGGGFDALGINSRDATPELLKYLSGNRTTLLGNENTAADTAFTGVSMANAVTDQNFENKENAQTELGWGRDEEARVKAEDLRLKNENLKRASYDFMKLHGNNTELATNAIRQSDQFSIEDKQTMFGIVSGTSPELTGVTSASQEAAEFSEPGMMGDRALSQRNADTVIKRNQNPALALYEKAITGGYSGNTDASAKLQEEILGTDEAGKWANNEGFGDTAGNIVSSFNKLKKEFPHATDAVIATVLKNSTGTDGWIFTGKPDTDLKAARLALDPFRTKESVDLMGQEYRQWADEDKQNQLLQSQFEKSKKAYASALDTGDQTKAAAAEKKMWEVLERYGIKPGTDAAKEATQPDADIGSIIQRGLDKNSGSSPPPTPEQQAQVAAATQDYTAQVEQAKQGLVPWPVDPNRASSAPNMDQSGYTIGGLKEGQNYTDSLKQTNPDILPGSNSESPITKTPAQKIVQQVAQQGTGQFANEPASVVSEMISSTLEIAPNVANILQQSMEALDEGSLSEAQSTDSRNRIGAILEDSLSKYTKSGQPIPPELGRLIADMQSKYLPLSK